MNNNLDEVLTLLKESMLREINKVVPAKVVSYNHETNRATVQLQRTIVNQSDNSIRLKPIADVPVIQLGGGGFNVFVPLSEGDLGLVLCADFNIGAFLDSYNEAPARDSRTHDLADSIFLPFRYFGLNAGGGQNLLIQKLDGSAKIEITADSKVKIKALEVEVDAQKTTFNHKIYAEDVFLTAANQFVAQHKHNQTNNQPTTTMIP
jgi:hypothetical protein